MQTLLFIVEFLIKTLIFLRCSLLDFLLAFDCWLLDLPVSPPLAILPKAARQNRIESIIQTFFKQTWRTKTSWFYNFRIFFAAAAVVIIVVGSGCIFLWFAAGKVDCGHRHRVGACSAIEGVEWGTEWIFMDLCMSRGKNFGYVSSLSSYLCMKFAVVVLDSLEFPRFPPTVWLLAEQSTRGGVKCRREGKAGYVKVLLT